MWPKAFAQFVELAPHISRLLPMADRFFQSKNASEDASRKAEETNRRAIEALGEGLRADLNQVTIAHAGLSEQLSDLGKRLGRIETDAQATRLSAESLENRLTTLETRQSRLFLFLALIFILLATICILEAMIFGHFLHSH